MISNIFEDNCDNFLLCQTQIVKNEIGDVGGGEGGVGMGQDNEMIVRQLWEELPDTQEEGGGGGSGGGTRRGRGRGGGRAGDMRVRLERSRQSARECRARKKLRYQYLDDMIAGMQVNIKDYHKISRKYFQSEREPMRN